MSLKVVSLFAGIGGFDLAAQRNGHGIVAHVEKDANCRKLLAAKWPNAIALDDVTTVGAHNLPPCDVVCGGWPCQDLSVAGLRAGLSGKRSGLFYELTRIISELRPRYFVGENVPGIFSSDGGRDFARVLGELGNIGARDIAWATLDAQWFGVAQRRRRVFFVADFGGERADEILSLSEGLRGHPAPSRDARKNPSAELGRSVALSLNSGRDGYNDGSDQTYVAGTLSACASAGGGLGTDFELSGGAVAGNNDQGVRNCVIEPVHTLAIRGRGDSHQLESRSHVRRLTPRECERLQGFPEDWTAGFSDSTRYRMLGNAVAVPVVQWIFSRL